MAYTTTNISTNITKYSFTSATVQEVFDVIGAWFLSKGWGKWDGTTIDNTQPHYTYSTTDKAYAALTQPYDVNKRMGYGVKYVEMYISGSNIYFKHSDSINSTNGTRTNDRDPGQYMVIYTTNDFDLYCCGVSSRSFVLFETIGSTYVMYTEYNQKDHVYWYTPNSLYLLEHYRSGYNTFIISCGATFYSFYSSCYACGYSYNFYYYDYYYLPNTSTSGNPLDGSYIVSDVYTIPITHRCYDIKFLPPDVGSTEDTITLKVDSDNFLSKTGTDKQFMLLRTNAPVILYPKE